MKNISFILPDDEVYHCIAEIADTIKKNYWPGVHEAKLLASSMEDYEILFVHLHPVPTDPLISKHPAPGLPVNE